MKALITNRLIKGSKELFEDPMLYGYAMLILLVACAPGLTKPGQRIYQIQSDYNAGLTIAVAYKALPACPAALICKKPEIVTQLQEADDIAGPAVLSAQACVRSPTCTNADLAVQAAATAVAALTKITNSLQVK